MSGWMKFASVWGLTLCIFAVDCLSPIGLTVPFFYVLPILLAHKFGSRRGYLKLAGVLIALTILGGILSRVPHESQVGIAMFNRAFLSIVLIVLAYTTEQRAAAEATLRGEATQDPLTGIANRRHADQWLATEFDRAKRYGTPLTVAILDIDHFKRVNDTYGHPVGDVVIQTLAAECAKQVRPFDLAARIGGEEFILGLPQTSGDAALALAERLRQAVMAIRVDTKLGELKFTISVGVAEMFDDDENVGVVSARADKALYASKEGGRNQVRLVTAEIAELEEMVSGVAAAVPGKDEPKQPGHEVPR